jgi:hypothetical protein
MAGSDTPARPIVQQLNPSVTSAHFNFESLLHSFSPRGWGNSCIHTQGTALIQYWLLWFCIVVLHYKGLALVLGLLGLPYDGTIKITRCKMKKMANKNILIMLHYLKKISLAIVIKLNTPEKNDELVTFIQVDYHHPPPTPLPLIFQALS